MLTPRQNLIETITPGGNPDRFVKQYEPFKTLFGNPVNKLPGPDGVPVTDEWGITRVWPQGTPGAFPVHDEEHIVIKDIEHWQDYLKAPDLDGFGEGAWDKMAEAGEAVNREEYFATAFVAPGLFEHCHFLCEITRTLEYFYEYPDEMHDLIKFLVEYNMKCMDKFMEVCSPDAVLQHDDWGMQANTFLSPDMWAEFFLEPYKDLYGYYKQRGIELIVHHADCYAATLVPYMIEIGIDIWQGVIDTNNIPELVEKYGGQITFFGGLNNGTYDVEGWKQEDVREGLENLIESTNGGKFLIPGLCQGLPFSTYPGLYQAVDEEIDKLSQKYFG